MPARAVLTRRNAYVFATLHPVPVVVGWAGLTRDTFFELYVLYERVFLAMSRRRTAKVKVKLHPN